MPSLLERADWQPRAACRNENGKYFFHPSGERGANRALREAHAKAICHTCPVLAECREYALAAREPDGIWGGLSRQDRDLRIASALPTARRPVGAEQGAMVRQSE